jgi:uncharacterized protein
MAGAALYRRRELIGLGVGGVALVGLGGAFWSDLFGAAASRGHARGPGYGPLGAPDANGIRLPAGFRSRLVAPGGRPVGDSGYVWHEASDGAATFPLSRGGWILVSNSEASPGGASAIRFAPDGTVRDAYRILEGTVQNCSGGGTPWGTWLSCEEVQNGLVWECDPAGGRRARARPAMGVFKHEAAAVDPVGRRVYLTEDLENGCLYRFTPERWPRLESGVLEVARVDSRGGVEWLRVPDPAARRRHTRDQVPGAARFKRAEGIFLDDGVLYVATTLDSRIHAYDLRRGRIEVVYDGLALARPPLTMVDQLSVSPGGELYACEDNSEPDIDVAVVDRRGRATRFLTLTGPVHSGSEATGIAFDPLGTRLYVASQRAHGGGAVYEIAGPFRSRPGKAA